MKRIIIATIINLVFAVGFGLFIFKGRKRYRKGEKV